MPSCSRSTASAASGFASQADISRRRAAMMAAVTGLDAFMVLSSKSQELPVPRLKLAANAGQFADFPSLTASDRPLQLPVENVQHEQASLGRRGRKHLAHRVAVFTESFNVELPATLASAGQKEIEI